MTGSSSPFWAYRAEQETLGKAFGAQPWSTKAFYASAQGIAAGTIYGAMSWAYYPDKFVFSHKGTVEAGPSRGMAYLRATLLRPIVAFTATGLTFTTVESLMEELSGSHQKDPFNSAVGGAAAGLVVGGFLTRRYDIASMTALATGMVMGLVELNGSNMICDPITDQERKFPATLSAKFEESKTLSDLKATYPDYKNN